MGGRLLHYGHLGIVKFVFVVLSVRVSPRVSGTPNQGSRSPYSSRTWFMLRQEFELVNRLLNAASLKDSELSCYSPLV